MAGDADVKGEHSRKADRDKVKHSQRQGRKSRIRETKPFRKLFRHIDVILRFVTRKEAAFILKSKGNKEEN